MLNRALQTTLLAVGMLVPATFTPVGGAESDTNAWPHFQEVFRLLRANLEGVTEADLNRAAVQGLLHEFSPRVNLVEKDAADEAAASGEQIAQISIYDRSYGYLRVARVNKGLADEIGAAYEKLNSTNKLKGLILDLRFADGQEYAAAAAAADRFLTREKPLVSWGDASARSTAKDDAITAPLTALINRQTSGAAEALAAVLRETGAALLIGSNSAGAAHVFKEFTLSTGQKLRVATGSVVVGDGHPLSAGGVAPDIEVQVSDADEKSYFADAFKVLAGTIPLPRSTNTFVQGGSTNRPRRINEAELVRRQREGQSPDELAVSTTTADNENAEPVVRDPVLARALDLLKGIAIVGQARRP